MTQEDLKQISDLLDEKLDEKLKPIKQDIDSLKQGQALLNHQVGFLYNKVLEHDKKFEEMEENMKQWKDEILTSLDRIMEELRLAREERVIHLKGSHDRIDEVLENHEVRIIKLEQLAMAN